MGLAEHLQSSFAAGVWSARLHGHVDDPNYRRALSRCDDWEITPQGSLRRAPGSIFVSSLGTDPRVRLIPFPTTTGQDFYLVLSPSGLTLFSESGQLPFFVGGSELETLVNGDFASGAGWTLSSGASIVNGALHLHGNYETGASARSDFTPSATANGTVRVNWKTITGRFDPSAPISPLDHTTKLTGRLKACRITVTKVSDGSVAGSWSGVPADNGVTSFSAAVVSGTAYRFTISIELYDAFTPTYTQDVDAYVDTVSLTEPNAGSSDYSLSVPWDAAQIAQVRWASEPGRNRVYFVHPNVAPWFIERSATGSWTWQAITFDTAPVDWTGTNWPAVVAVYQNRLVLAATPAAGNTIWTSKSLNPFDMRASETVAGTPSVVLSSSAIVAPLSTRGRIRWLRGRNMLLVGTDEGEYSVTAQGGAISPLDMQVRQESAFGSSDTEAQDIGFQVLYVSRDQAKVRAINFSFDTQTWMSREVSFAAEHLFRSSIQGIVFARDPSNLIVGRLGDGTLACCTYQPEEQVAAWWTRDNGGVVLDMTVLHGVGGSVLYVAVQRGTAVLLEKIPWGELADRAYSDSAAIAYNTDPAWTLNGDGLPVISGLDRFEGQQVNVVLDGAIEEPLTVASGQVTLARTGSRVEIGLPYDSIAETLPPAGDSQRPRRRWVKLFLRLFQSAFPLIEGLDGSPSSRVRQDRSVGTLLDGPEPLMTGDVGGRGLSTDYEDRGQVRIRQDQPLRTEIVAIFGSRSENAV